MKRVLPALVLFACSSPSTPEPAHEKAAAPEPAAAIEQAVPPPPEVEAEPPKPAAPKYADANAVLDAMATDVPALADAVAIAAYLERVRGVPGIASAEPTKGSSAGFAIKLETPVDAAELAAKFLWNDIYAVSGDAQQKSFALHVSKGEVEGSKGKQLATEFPHLGPFRVEARLVERPAGKPPKITAGASPAYDVTKHKGRVQWLFLLRER